MGKTVEAIIGVVAAVVIAVVAPYLAPIALGVLGITATATAVAIATAVIGITLSVGLSLAFKALGIGSVPAAKAQVGPPSIFRQAISDSFIVFGKRRVGGLVAFFHARVSGDDHYRYFVIACAGHRCQGVVSWMLNDAVVTVDGTNKVTSGKYAGNAWLWFQRGLASETANSTFVSECGGKWTTNHKGNGITAIYAKFKLSDNVVNAGMPNITAIIEGRDEILDTRTSTTGYTNNGALVFYDWMKMLREEGGFGSYADEIPDDAWISAQANVCDETVSSEPRYTLNAVLTTGSPPSEVRDAMIVNMGGSYTFSCGKHLMRPGYWVPVSATLSEDDLSSGIQVSPFYPSDIAANEIQGSFIDPAKNYQGGPLTTQSVAADSVKQMDLDLAFTTSLKQADRVAKIMLKRAQCEKTVVWPGNIALLGTRALDTVQVDSTRYSLSNYAWVISNWALSADYGVVLSLREENEDIYADDAPTSPVTPPTITQPSTPLSTLAQIQQALRDTFLKSGFTPTAVDAGSNATIKLHGPTLTDTFTIDYPGNTSDPVISPLNLTGLAYSTTYYLYADIDSAVGVGDPAPTFGAATVYGDAINSTAHPYRFYLWRTVTTPASGGGTTTGSGGGSGGGGGGGFGGSGPYP
jgi:hypothetical protein